MKLQIRQERERHKWTLEYIAQQVGRTKASVHDIETGRRKPSYDVLVKLLKLFGYVEATKAIEQLFAVVDDTHNLSEE